jgi:hypothetical protein
MKNYKTIIAAVVAGLACSAASTYASITYNFSDALIANSGIQFNGNSTFQINPTAPTVEFEGFIGGTLYGGYITGAPWTIGAITINGATQSATVTTPGVFTIITASGNLTGNLSFGTITTTGTGDNINLAGAINVNGISYSGTDANILALLGGNTSGIFSLSAQYNSGDTLTQLTHGSEAGNPTTFSGSFNAVPEPTTIVAGALMLLPLGIGALRSLRKEQSPTV